MNDTFRITFRAMVVAAVTLLTGSTATAQVHVNGSVYGGGNLADVGGSVTVNMIAGTVDKDVYGGGALANTNIANDATIKTTVNLLGGTIVGDAYGGGLGRQANNNATPAVTAVEAKVYGDVKIYLNGMDKSFYDAADATMKTVFDTRITKPEGASYYLVNTNSKGAVVKRVFGANNKNGSPKGNVTVHVFGTQHKDAEDIRTKLKNANADLEKGSQTDEQYKTVLKGVLTDMITKAGILHIAVTNNEGTGYQDICNNTTSTADALKKAINDINDEINAKILDENTSADDIDALFARIYDVEAVYGGGNEAAYIPTTAWNGSTGSKTQVIIEGCDETSIEAVYGGGNAASVPETNVDIVSAHEIQTVFGGGNGKDNKSDGSANPGADVGVYKVGSTETIYGTGNATTLLEGGYFHEAYGASNSKGNIKGNISINTNPDGSSCSLKYDKLVGAGKNADVDKDVIMILGCNPRTKNPLIFGGADNANVNGNVELTITSGTFGKVFGGNNLGGIIKGHIKVNIEETECTPIRIDELYLGGNQAAYSRYGYYKDGDVYKPRTAAMAAITDPNAVGYQAAEEGNHTAPYDEPVLNVISCTYIGKVFGGGYGERAVLYGNPTVNINMIAGLWASELGAADKLGEIVDVFGGGNAAKVEGNTTVNIGTATKVEMVTAPSYLGTSAYTKNTTTGLYEVTSLGANIVGNVYGGGNEADVTGNTFVNICAVKSGTIYSAVAEGSKKVTIAGNAFGGGKGIADNFYCDKAMVGINGAGADKVNYPDGYPDGNTSVIIGNGTVNGSVYGGGEIGRVEMNTAVTIGIEGGTTTSAPRIKGNVFGAGKGLETHGYAALVRGNPIVTIQGNAKVDSCVYGGGEIASVARYQVVGGVPVALAGEEGNYSGYCTVNVLGNAIIGPDEKMVMHHVDAQGNTVNGSDGFPLLPDDAGHVFAAGKGVLPKIYTYADNDHRPKRMLAYNDETISKISSGEIPSGHWEYSDAPTNKNIWQYFKDETQYFEFIQTLALATQTEVTVSGNAFVKGSVYGGSQNGLVQYDTHVTIEGGQIGCGKNTTDRHPDVWGENYTVPEGTDLECASWEYDPSSGAPYDPYAKYLNSEDGKYYYDEAHTESKYAEGGSIVAKDGHTYYGNVFGGGSGSVPYFDTEKGISRYIPTAGEVKGDTYVTISGGHILTNVYGGNEATNVLGTAHVTMTGGTIGVPRTPQQIKDHPVTCYLFGAGKGDQRIFFNKETNVKDAIVTVEGGRIYGSVFGGGEDGHVLRNTEVNIGKAGGTGPKIGTVGSTYVDGNVFGGGRGFSGEALTAGNVGGSVALTINGGEMLGSIYGGGRLASVGYGLYLTTETGYGEMRDDKEYDGSYPNPSPDDAETFYNKGRGHIIVTINGGTIGKEFTDDKEGEHSGNVFGGSMGRLTKLDGTPFDAEHWPLLATAKSTTVNINGGIIKRSVYGGGEMGTVTTDAIVNVSGGTIGTSGKGGAEFGNVYGGGKGYVDPAGSNYVTAGIIKGNTKVIVENGTNTTPTIYHNIYGGGAYGSVGVFDYDTTTGMPTGRKANTTGGKATVNITGGTIGTTGKENGMIFGSSRGDVGAPGSIHDKLAWVYDTEVTIGGGQINGSVYGGGENGHIFNDAAVTVHSGTIGIAVGGEIIDNNGTPDDDSDDITYTGAEYPYRGNVYGGGCGTDKYYRDPAQETHDGNGQLYNPLAGIVQGDASVSIDGGLVVHNVYGAGAMGSVGTMTKDANNHLAITNDGTTTVAISGGTIGVSGTVGVGNVYGAARGDSLYTEKGVAQVRSTSVTISQADGKTTMIYGNVYGGGETGDVGTYTNTYTSTGSKNYVWDKIDSKEIGGCSVSVTGGQIKGNVFGAGKGVANSFECEKAIVRTATVSVSAGTVNGNVYGGGEIGRVDQNTKVTIGDETATSGTSSPVIAGDVFGAGAGKETHGYSALVRGDAEVIIQGNAAVGKSVYGGGEIAAVGRYGLDSDNMPTTLVSGGECKVTVKGSAKIGTVSGGNVFGAGKGVNPFDDDHTYIDFTSNSESKWPKRMTIKPGAGQTLPVHYTEINGTDYIWEYYTSKGDYFKYLQTLALATDTKVSIEGSATVNGSVYGGSESGFVQRDTEIKIQGGEIGSADTNGTITTEGNVYGGGKGLLGFDNAGRVSGGVTIAVSDGQTHGDVYGGGELGVIKGSVLVNILGGTIDEDVYGGGALANTNTNNWNGTTLSETYLETSGLTVGTSSVVGYYTKSGDTYRAATGTAEANTKYYRKVNTAVNLFGGYIKGDAYGGGLGQKNGFNGANSDKDAIVYGDVDVTLGDAVGAATRFFIGHYADDASTTDNESKLVNSGRVFGCNNLKGSPMGNVTVTVNSTVKGNVERTPSSTKVYGYGKKLLDDPGYVSTYEVAAVYGGGNLAPYEAVGKNTHVIINGCEKTSIETVYGGGNAAAVPETKVDINGTYEIGAVFGGGNGKDKYKSDAGWVTNPGANVNGPTTTWIYGGTIHEAYGASNEKGTISGNASIDVGAVAASDPNYCRLDVGKVVGAGKNADVNGSIITILGCKPSEEIPIYYGGADNANVNGNVELTITSGNFGQVFGGNNLGGAIRGHIILNIEETGDCETPITIEKLYLGGNQATYSRYGYYVKTEETEAGTGKGASGETAVLTTGETKKLIFMPRTSATDSHLPVNTYEKDAHDNWTWTTTAIADFTPYEEPKMNVISCTRIDSIYGGGYGVGGDMYANPTVNINMIPGSHAATAITRAALNGAANDHRLGAIGAVFGGGDAADVIGNTTVNIGTATTVNLTSIPDDDTTPDVDESLRTVEGAYITGSVYGGGNKADVKGNTYVNICANQADDASTADVIEYAGVTVGGTGCEGVTIKGNVFGGGKGIADSFTCAKAMVGVIDTNNGDIDITKEVTGDGTSKGTRVSIGNGTVEGTVYGGGEVGRVEWNSVVTIGLSIENGTSEPVIVGSVFGAGKGVEQYGYAALVRGNTFVTIQEKAKVGHSVYGGGEIASVGKYKVVGGVPTSLANQGSGYCNVIVRGNAEIGPDNMVMYNTTTGKPDDWGHVFGAGKGILPYEDKDHFECLTHKGTDGHGLKHPGSMKPGTDSNPNGTWECYEGDEAKYLDFVETQALATQTEVVIGGNAFVKGSVYGGSENGHVQHSTHVTIQETCQIGAGYDKEQKKSLPKYAEAAFINPLTTPVTSENALAECAHWDYDKDSGSSWDMYATYQNTADGKYYYGTDFTDPANDAKDGSYIAKDGHTFYGNVFGGGSGLIPYAPGKWHRAAGSVGGNTVVDITGGHILTSVYGGNEQTDVGTYKKDNNGALVVPVSGGKCTINMTGGTVGVPRTVTQINEHPVICYVFGAGKGDQRIFFNTWTNVINTEVNIGGNACIYGSVLGGGEDGHVIRDAVTNIGGTVEIGTEQIAHSGVVIGTTGTSYVDGNVFGGGRGFSGEAQTAGTVGGNVALTISGGNVLGSVYGGGRLASVGTEFTAPESPNYGQFMEDDADGTYGHVIVNIGGGTIGNGEDGKDVTSNVSGNVFGGSMGRLTLLNGTTINPLWPKMAQVKSSVVNIYGNAVVKRTVFGGGELGTVRDDAYVTIGGIKTSDADANGKVNIDKQGTPIVRRDVYGGGYGSEDYQTETTVTVYMAKDGGGYDPARFRYTPMQWAGCVGKNTYVNVVGGQVRKSVYGGGEMASVGIINSQLDANDNCIGIVKHDDEKNGFALSWPYEFTYFPGYPGDTHVTVTGGRIGLKGGEDNTFEVKDNGDVVGGGKGIAGNYNNYIYCANVGSTNVTIDYPSTADPASYDSNGSVVECVTGAVYGGAENGHVMGNTKLTLKKGLVGHSVYGGGSGKGTFSTKQLKIGAPANSTSESDYYTRDIYSITAGKVFGNTEVIMQDGYVVRNVYGGGNMGSVGKGNYAGGADDYSTAGYGETLSGNLWDGQSKFSEAFLSSGKSTVKILGGTVGYIASDPSESMYPMNSTASLPYGNVFGGCRGESAPNIRETPRYLYSPEFFVGYVNETDVTIGAANGTGPTIIGSVYGGGMDGHVRRDTYVEILGGEIGIPYTSENIAKVQTKDLNNTQWVARGNVYGAGSGIGKYKYDFDYDGKYTSTVKYHDKDTKEEDYSTSAGSVTRFTTVDIKGGKIHRNVYGGGSLSSIGAPKIGQDYDPYHPDDSEHGGEAGKLSLNKVAVSGGQIGDADGFAVGYGGDVFAASRGDETLDNPSSFANSVWTDVSIKPHATDVTKSTIIYGEVYGGGEVGAVKQSTNVQLTGGTIKHDAFGGGKGTSKVAADVGGDVLVELNKGVAENAKGCIVDRIFGANNVNGTPKGHVKVHVHATQNKDQNDISTKSETKGVYDMTYVFGGGNASDYVPEDETQSTEVIIDGCGLTSIYEVYGGGYGAATPGTNVRINGTEIIDNVFGGGYGAGVGNPGANVGYRTDHSPYGLYLNDNKTKIAIVNLMAGKVNSVYGGSNTKGDIRNGAATETVDLVAAEGACPKLEVGELYGGGKNAEMEGGAEIILRCMPDSWIGEVYAGAREANVGNDVSLTITSGKFEHVYGGNKSSGKIDGYVEVNIEECPTCNTPVIIGELYGGGNEAAYNLDTEKYGKDYPSPRVNVRAFTSIGTIYGGGKGEGAKVTGNPTVSINVGMVDGGGYDYDPSEDKNKPDGVTLYSHEKGKIGVIGNVFGGGNAAEVNGSTNVLIGTESYVQINRIVAGETDLSNGDYYTRSRSGAGTEEDPYVYTYTKATGIAKENTVYYTPVIGVDIKGNVYGGGNNAGVTGNTNVTIGKEEATTP